MTDNPYGAPLEAQIVEPPKQERPRKRFPWFAFFAFTLLGTYVIAGMTLDGLVADPTSAAMMFTVKVAVLMLICWGLGNVAVSKR